MKDNKNHSVQNRSNSNLAGETMNNHEPQQQASKISHETHAASIHTIEDLRIRRRYSFDDNGGGYAGL